MRKNILLINILLLNLTVNTALAANATSELLQEELRWLQAESVDITVTTASRKEQKLEESPSAISVITKNEILRAPVHNIPELLQYVVGMDGYTKTYTDMDVAARGMAYDETPKMLVLVDGQAVNVVPYSGMQWPTLPLILDDIERIEILRGPGSSVYGADALVGIIHIFTQPVKERKNMVSVMGGEGGTTHNSVQFATPLAKDLNFGATLSYVQTEKEGDQETAEARLAAPNWEIKDWAEIFSGNFKLDYKKQRIDFASMGGYSTDEEGYNPSPGDYAMDKSEKDTFFLNNKFGYHFENTDDVLLRLGYRGLRQENQKFNADDREYLFKYKVRKGDAFDVDLQYNINRFKNHSLIFGLNYNVLEASREISNPSGLYIYDQQDTLKALYIQDQFRAFDDRVLFTVGGRYDKWDDFDGVFTPRASANIFIPSKNKFTLRAAASTSFRRPSFDENYYFVEIGPPNTGWFKGSSLTQVIHSTGEFVQGKALEPEELTAYELGLRWQSDAKNLYNIEYYHNKITNIVGYNVYDVVPPGVPVLGFESLGTENVIQGIEFEAKNRYSDTWSSFFNYTYQWGEDADGNDLNNLPKNKLNAGITYLGVVDVDLRMRYVSGVTFSEVSAVSVDEYSTFDLAISKMVHKNLFLKLSVLNLLDDEHYEYPLYTKMTRKALLTLKYSF